jgi:hypothetical protein
MFVMPFSLPARLPAIAAVLAGTLLICAHAAVYGRWLVDDAAITFDYARNVAEGFGPVVQPGAPPVEGYSNTSWMLLLILGRYLGLFDHGTLLGVPDYVVYPKLLAALFCAGTLVAVHRAAAVLVRRPSIVTLGAGVALACLPSYVAWSFSGLENSCYGFLVTALAATAVRAIAQHRPHAIPVAVRTGLFAFAAALTRPDGMIFAVSFPLVVLLLMTKDTIRASVVSVVVSLLSFGMPFGAFLLWRHAEFGRWVSNTAAAKSQPLKVDAETVTAFNNISGLAGYIGVVGTLVALVIIGCNLGTASDFRRRLVGALVPLVLAIFAFGFLAPDWMAQFRFATPIWTVGALVVTACAYRLFATGGLRIRVVAAIGVVAAIATSLTLLDKQRSDFAAAPTVPLCAVVDSAGRQINQLADIARLGNDVKYLGPDLGGSSLTARLRIVDLAGLTDSRIADYRAGGDMRGLGDHVFGEVRPAIINAELAWNLVGLDPRLDTDYYFLNTTDPTLGGTYIRKDLVPDPAVLARLRAAKMASRQEILDRYAAAPHSSCGDTLTPP